MTGRDRGGDSEPSSGSGRTGTSRVRAARPADAGRIRELQSRLRQPSPDLLEYGLAVGAVRVSLADGGPASDSGSASDGGPASDAGPGGRVAGYLLPVDAPNRSGVHIAELVVAPDCRREGRASELLRAVVREASGPVTLQAHPNNEAALALYESLGFSVVDRRADAYDDGDALVLRLE
ncbi:N-acetyltransferase [Halorubrum sp. BV1]|uniref:GNAT family N-acetyltransferase n=1 Tax=Halorubrum sp. BV1 TaxID=1498500 RepID=UPI000679316A|nr:N-acetyltransferase [Halorubrum sp. BV1]